MYVRQWFRGCLVLSGWEETGGRKRLGKTLLLCESPPHTWKLQSTKFDAVQYHVTFKYLNVEHRCVEQQFIKDIKSA